MKKFQRVIILLSFLSLGALSTACQELPDVHHESSRHIATSSKTTHSSTSTNTTQTDVIIQTSEKTVKTLETTTEALKKERLQVIDGAILERDIIPQLETIFGLTTEQVKAELSQVNPSALINPAIDDWRKLEGILPVGELLITEEDMLTQMNKFIEEREGQVEKLLAAIPKEERNDLDSFAVLRLASIVEAEALQNQYLEETAAVFLNRIDTGMRLQSCVTAEYAVGHQRSFLVYEDMEYVSPYNTYTIDGLPPTPICSVDDESLLHSAKVSQNKDIFYFFYDYIEDKMYFYEDFTMFQEEANNSFAKFKEHSELDPFAIINKQALYGVEP